MHLKRLELFGFKTFADRTEFEFLPGITAVVGPNGSGKSNIADAVQWVLGEQSMRSLRSLSSQDVIFAGTHRRRPLGFAEVSLTFDNSSRTLPLDFDEVVVTRRVYRSGESEYRVNRVACRLRDILELFMDTGVGCEAYSIIGQSEVDAVLSIRPEDRRALVEEAAGIKKYRSRKREAARKLEAAQANLTRVSDITAEIEAQLPPLREQAEVAHRYRALREKAQALERSLLLTEHRRAQQQVAQVRQARAAAEGRVEAARAELARIEAECEAARLVLARADTDLDEARGDHSAATQETERVRGALAVARERLASLETADAEEGRRLAELEAELERCRSQQAETTQRIGRAEAEERAALEALQAREAELAQVARRATELARLVEDRRGQALERARALTNAQADLRAAARRLTDLSAAVRRAQQRVEALEARQGSQESRGEALQAKLAEAEEQCQALSQEIKRAEVERATLQREIHLSTQRIADVRAEITGRTARLRTLCELEEKLEGYREGARSVLQAQRNGRLRGQFIPVADLMDVAPEFEAAIQAALGGDLDTLVAGSMEEALEAIDLLRREGGGRATFVTRQSGRTLPRPEDPEAFAGRLAVNYVRCADDNRALIEALLGDALVVRHLDEAHEVLSLDHARYRAVTLEGDLLQPSGVVTGGRSNGGAGSLLARRREIAALEAEVARLQAEHEEAVRAGESRPAALRTCEAGLRRLREQASQASSALATARKDLDYAAQERKRLAEELQRARQAAQQAERDLEKAREQEARARSLVTSLQSQETLGDADIGRFQSDLDDLSRRREALSGAVADQRVAVARARQQAESLREGLARIREHEGELLARIQQRVAGRGARAARAAELREEVARQEAVLATLTASVERAQERLDACRAERGRLLEAAGQAEQSVRETRERVGAAEQELHRAEVKLAGLEADIQHAQAALFEQFGLSADALEGLEAGEVTEVRNRQQAAQELRQLRAQMAELGEVNLGAIEEVRRLEERLQFLAAQHADLSQARDGLLQVIAEIDVETRDRFLRTVERLREAFDEVFVRLFSGGSTSIRLTDPEDVLEGGLDIVVQPPGKKAQSLLLLSGGERALTAAAFLFALLRIRPSPFVLLDEVDAPLDESNVVRFSAMLREFAERSQFIVITHNKGTMEAADVLYGVAMPEPGVSHVVSVRLEDVPQAA